MEIFSSISNYYFLAPEKIETTTIRELHTYGQSIPLPPSRRPDFQIRPNKAVQHSGLGHRLMREAEKIAKTKGYKKIAVISGVGVREYYRKLGYHLEKTYMTKNLD